jgi:hypothetical protein
VRLVRPSESSRASSFLNSSSTSSSTSSSSSASSSPSAVAVAFLCVPFSCLLAAATGDACAAGAALESVSSLWLGRATRSASPCALSFSLSSVRCSASHCALAACSLSSSLRAAARAGSSSASIRPSSSTSAVTSRTKFATLNGGGLGGSAPPPRLEMPTITSATCGREATVSRAATRGLRREFALCYLLDEQLRLAPPVEELPSLPRVRLSTFDGQRCPAPRALVFLLHDEGACC